MIFNKKGNRPYRYEQLNSTIREVGNSIVFFNFLLIFKRDNCHEQMTMRPGSTTICTLLSLHTQYSPYLFSYAVGY